MLSHKRKRAQFDADHEETTSKPLHTSTSSVQTIKNFLHRVVPSKFKKPKPLVPLPVEIEEPAKKKRKLNNPNEQASFITSSPKPCKKFIKNSNKYDVKPIIDENIENNSQPEPLRSPKNSFNYPKSISISAPGLRRGHSFDMSLPTIGATGETLFSPMFKASGGCQKSHTFMGCLTTLSSSTEFSTTAITKLEEKTPSPKVIFNKSDFELRTDESLDDFLLNDFQEEVSCSQRTDVTDDIELVLNQSNSSLDMTEVSEDLESLIFIKSLPPVPQEYLDRVPHLPPRHPTTPKITLVLDLDETLVHCDTNKLDNPDYNFKVEFNSNLYNVWGRKRPFVDKFLKAVAKSFEVVIFTASQQIYADHILDKLDENGVIDHRLFRESCVFVAGNYLKDLHILGRDLSKVIIIDNSITSFAYQVDNGIPITSWYDDNSDVELMDLLPFLDKLKDVDDVRPYLRSTFKLQQQMDRLD